MKIIFEQSVEFHEFGTGRVFAVEVAPEVFFVGSLMDNRTPSGAHDVLPCLLACFTNADKALEVASAEVRDYESMKGELADDPAVALLTGLHHQKAAGETDGLPTTPAELDAMIAGALRNGPRD